MANRYWVGGASTWDATAGTKWSTTSGGTGGQAVPTTSDTVFFDASSGANTVTIGTGYTALCSTLTMTGFTGTLAFGSQTITAAGTGTIFTGDTTFSITGTPVINCTNSGSTARTISAGAMTEANSISFNITAGTGSVTITGSSKNLDFTGFSGTMNIGTRTIYGDLTLSTGMTISGTNNTTTFGATSGTKIITSNGKTIDFFINFNGVGGTWKIFDNLTQGSARNTTLTNGTLDLNGKTYTAGASFATAGTAAKNLTFNGGTLTCVGTGSTAFTNNGNTNFTTTAGTGTGKISMSAATAKTFAGNGSTYNCTLENSGAGALTISGNNTITTISNSVQPTTFTFTSGTTNTVTNFSVSGTSGNLVTLNATSTSAYTLSKSSGTVSVSYCDISYSTATGGATWQAYTSNGNINSGNNTGWDFGVTNNGLFFGSNF